jgi:Fe2+ or Zn2+ uptake regulation protein
MEYRRSKQRDTILTFLKNTRIHPTADWIYLELKKKIPNISLGTVYRNLQVLEEMGEIQKIPGENTFRYEAKIDPHYHLICEKCGTMVDFEMPHYELINKDAEKMSAFKIARHRIDFYGICSKCQNKSK